MKELIIIIGLTILAGCTSTKPISVIPVKCTSTNVTHISNGIIVNGETYYVGARMYDTVIHLTNCK